MDENECLERLTFQGGRIGLVVDAWSAQIKDRLLWRASREAVRMHDPGRLQPWRRALDLPTVRDILANAPRDGAPSPRFGSHHVDLARAMLWCAEEAATSSERTATGIQAGLNRLNPTSDITPDLLPWAWVCRRTLQGAFGPSPSVAIPVAGWVPSPGTEGIGFLATLLLERLDYDPDETTPAPGHVALHPMDAFHTHWDGEFWRGLQNAWDFARGPAAARTAGPFYDGRWRLLQGWNPAPRPPHDPPPAPTAHGRSASGAAAMGWVCVLNDRKPDSRVLHLAQILDNAPPGVNAFAWEFDGVDGIPAKVQAASEAGCFDTLVVASEDDRGQAQRKLDTLRTSGRIRVVTYDAAHSG